MCPTPLDPATTRPTMQPPEAYIETETEDGPPDGGPVEDRPRFGGGGVRTPADLTRKADREAATDWLRDAIEGPLACGRGRAR